MLDKNDYKEILFTVTNILIIFFCILLLGCSIASATTLQEDLTIKRTAEGVCSYFKNPCNIKLSSEKRVQAYTTIKGDIVLSKGLRNILDYNQLKAVCMHEVGHHLLKHYERQDEFFEQTRTKPEVIAMRHRHELEADLFSTAYSIYINEPSYLPSALRTITAPQYLNTTTETHPSYNTRVRNIQRFQTYVTTGQSYRSNNIRYYQPYYLPYNK